MSNEPHDVPPKIKKADGCFSIISKIPTCIHLAAGSLPPIITYYRDELCKTLSLSLFFPIRVSEV